MPLTYYFLQTTIGCSFNERRSQVICYTKRHITSCLQSPKVPTRLLGLYGLRTLCFPRVTPLQKGSGGEVRTLAGVNESKECSSPSRPSVKESPTTLRRCLPS